MPLGFSRNRQQSIDLGQEWAGDNDSGSSTGAEAT
jgi:hypothetical protein